MKVLIIVLIVLALLVLAGLIWMAMRQKKNQQGRLRADELRSKAADTATDTEVQAAKARESAAEAERVRAQADRLDVEARDERVAHDQGRAQQEEHLREADRLDPDVDHRSGGDNDPGTNGVAGNGRPGDTEPPADPRGRHQA